MASFSMGGASSLGGLGAAFGPWGAVAGGLIGGLLGGKPRLSREEENLYKFQHGLADQLRRFGQSIPLSDPGEQAALATGRGFLGEQQRQQRDHLYSLLPRTTAGGFQNVGDFSTNLSMEQGGQRIALDNAHLLNALSNRREGLLQASQAAGGALQAARGQRTDPGAGIPELFGQLAQAYASRNANRQAPSPPAQYRQQTGGSMVGYGEHAGPSNQQVDYPGMPGGGGMSAGMRPGDFQMPGVPLQPPPGVMMNYQPAHGPFTPQQPLPPLGGPMSPNAFQGPAWQWGQPMGGAGLSPWG